MRIPGLRSAALSTGREAADAIAERIAGALGHSTQAGSAEETFWAVRKLFEALAQERPLLVVFEDLHWAEPTLLDMIEHIADWSRGVADLHRMPCPSGAAREATSLG